MAATSSSPPASKSSSQASTTTTTTSTITQAPNPSRSNSSSKQKPTLQPSASTFLFAPSWLTKSESKQTVVPPKSGSPSPTTSSSATGSPSNSTPSSSSATMKRTNGAPKALKIENPVQVPKRNPFIPSTSPGPLSNIPPSSSSSSRNSIDSPRLKPSTSSPSSPCSPTTSTASTKRSPPPSQNRSRTTKSTVSEAKPASAFDANFPSLTAKPIDSTTPRSIWDDISSRKEKVLSPSSSSSGASNGTNIGLLEPMDDPFANMEKGAEYGMKIEMLKQLVPKVSSSGSQAKAEEARGRRGRSRTRVGSLGNIMAPLGSTSTSNSSNNNSNGNNGRGGSGGGSAQSSVERKESAEGGDRATLKRSLSSSASSSTNSLLKGNSSNSNNSSNNNNRSSQSIAASKLILKKGSGITENDGERVEIGVLNGRSLEEGINETLDTIRRVERERLEREKARAALSSKGEKEKIEKEKSDKGKEDMGTGKEKEKEKETLEERIEVPENWEDEVEDEESIRDDTHRKEIELPATATTTAPSTTPSSPTLSEASALTSNLGSRSVSPSTSANNSPPHSQRQVPNPPPGIPVSHIGNSISTPPLNNITEEPEDIEHDELSLPPTPPPEEKPFLGTISPTTTVFRESFQSRAESVLNNNNNITNANNASSDVTETDKQRLLETVRNWTGGSRRWENNCAFGERMGNSRVTGSSFNPYSGLVGVIGASSSRSPRLSERRASEIYPSSTSMGGWNPLTGNMVYSYHQQPPPLPSTTQGMNYPQTALFEFPAPMRRGSTGGVYLENRSIGLGSGLHSARDFGGINGGNIYGPSIETSANNWIAAGGGGDLGRSGGMVGWGGSGYGNGGVLRRGSEVGSFGW